MRYILGIDPGLGGGLALVNEVGQAECWPMYRSEGDLHLFFASTIGGVGLSAALEGNGNVMALLEQVTSHFPSVTAAAKLYGNYMQLRQAMTDHGLSFDLVTPGRWQKSFGLVRKKQEKPSQWKARLRQKAQQLFPQLERQVTLKTADALLIAEYGRRRFLRDSDDRSRV